MDDNNNTDFGKINFGIFSDIIADSEDKSLVFKNHKGQEIALVIPEKRLAEISEKYGYPLSEFESRDIAESISETADFYGLFINEEMITESIRACSILQFDTDRYKGGNVDYSMIEQISVLKALIHEKIDEYAIRIDGEIKKFLGFERCEDFDADLKKILDEIIIDLLIFREGNFDDNTVIEAAYLFFASLDRNYGNEIDEFFEFREKKPKPGTSLKDTADLLFAVYEDMCGGELE